MQREEERTDSQKRPKLTKKKSKQPKGESGKVSPEKESSPLDWEQFFKKRGGMPSWGRFQF